MQVKKQQLEPYTEQQTGSKLGNSLTRLYIVALLNYKCQVGWITSWNQDCWEKYQQPQICRGSSLVAQTGKCLPPMWETQVQSLGQEDPLEKGTATHSSIFPWRIPWTEETGRLQSKGSRRVRHNWSDLARMHNIDKRGKNMGDTKKRHLLAPGKHIQRTNIKKTQRNLTTW